MPCHGEPPGFTPRAISHNRQNRKFSACRALKKAAENQFYQEIATANTENGNCPADGVGLLGRIAACSPIHGDMETAAGRPAVKTKSSPSLAGKTVFRLDWSGSRRHVGP